MCTVDYYVFGILDDTKLYIYKHMKKLRNRAILNFMKERSLFRADVKYFQ